MTEPARDLTPIVEDIEDIRARLKEKHGEVSEEEAEASLASEIREQELEKCRAMAAEIIPPNYREDVVVAERGEGNRPVRSAIQEWIEMFMSDDARDDDWRSGKVGLCLIGRPGAGKTQVAWQIVRELLVNRGFRDLRFCKMEQVFDEITDISRGSRSDKDFIERLATVDLLVLDDLGAKKLSEFRETALLKILDPRWDHHRPTIITTNIASHKWGGPEGHFGDRNSSRIGGMSRIVVMPNFDHRTGLDYAEKKGKRS